MVRRPWVTGASLAALVGCVVLLDRTANTGSYAGRFLRNPLGNPWIARWTNRRPTVSYAANVYSARPGEWTLTSPFADGKYEGTPGQTLYMTYHHWVEDDGFWAPCVRCVEDAITIQTNPPEAIASVSPAEVGKARRTFVQATLKEWLPDPELPERLSERDRSARTILLGGVAHNAATVVSLMVFVVSLGWIAEWRRKRRRTRELAAGRCPSCGYSLVGLVGTTCPECGQTAL